MITGYGELNIGKKGGVTKHEPIPPLDRERIGSCFYGFTPFPPKAIHLPGGCRNPYLISTIFFVLMKYSVSIPSSPFATCRATIL